jgi:hypothetical protein
MRYLCTNPKERKPKNKIHDVSIVNESYATHD